jgi:hypothetical protein
MKKLILIAAVILVAGITYGQSLQKGTILGLHSGAPVVLNPGFTMDQYLSFLHDKYIPAYEKNFPGIKIFILKGRRGECTDYVGVLYAIESDAIRDKYWTAEGAMSDLAKAAVEKLKDLDAELAKYVKDSSSPDKYTDWLVL